MTTYNVTSGVTSSGVTFGNGDFLYVSSGGTANVTTVGYGGSASVSSGGTSTDTLVTGGGIETVFNGGTASGTTVDSAGKDVVSSGGVVSGVTVNSGGTEIVSYSGTASGTVLNSGGYLVVVPGGNPSGTVFSGGEVVSTGVVVAQRNGTTLYAGVVAGVVLSAGGAEIILPGGSASGTTVNSGGLEFINTDATASHTTVNAGGDAFVFIGGIDVGATVNSGGPESLGYEGSTVSTTLSGGYEVVSYGASTLSSTIDNAGYEVVSYGGSAVATTVSAGGYEVLSGGTAISTTLLPGGMIDLATIPYVSGGSASVNSGGLLSVAVGGEVYTQQLAGTYTADSFLLNRDSGNGVLVTAEDAANTATIASGATLTIAGTLTPGEEIVFSPGAPETLIVGSPVATISNPIVGFAEGDRIEFANGDNIDGDEILNGATLALTYQNTAGSIAVADLTNVSFAPNAPISTIIGSDPLTQDNFVTLTRYFAWIGGSGSGFETASNWNGGGAVPGPLDDATFNNGVGGTISGSASVGWLVFENAGTWSLASGTSLTAASYLEIGGGGGGTAAIGALTIGSGSTISTGDAFTEVGYDAGDIATLTVSGGGVLRQTGSLAALQYQMYIGGNPAAGTLAAASGDVVVTGTGSLIDLPFNGLGIGENGGSGTLTVSQGGSVLVTSLNSNVNNSLAIGRQGNGTLTVTDPGSEVTAVGLAYIAHSGDGTLTVANDATFLAALDPLNLGGLFIGDGSTTGVGGTGSATVGTGGVLDSQGELFVGLHGSPGQLTVLNAGTVQVGTTLVVGYGGTIAAGETYAGSGTLTIGAGGTVELTGGPQTTSYGVYLGNSNIGTAGTENAVATVTGTGALLNTDGNGITVGQVGSATLTVSQGASVVAGTANSGLISALAIGRQGAGTVTVTGAASQLTADGDIYVSRAGSGSLIIENLGSVAIGADGLGGGSLHIGGDGTTGGGTLYVGGTGTAVVASGGSLYSQGNIIVGQNGATGTLAVTGGTATAAGQLLIGDGTTLGVGGTLISLAGTIAVTSANVETGTGSVTVGAGGVLTIDQSGTSATAIVLGDAAGSTGALSATGGGTITAGGGLSLVQNATVSVMAGGGIGVAGVDEATNAAASDAITVSGTNSVLSSTGSFTVGDAGVGALSIDTGGTVSAANLLVGNAASSSGSAVDLSGAGSQLTVSGLLQLGAAGSGSLQLANGAVVTLGTLDAAQSAAAVADISVSGSGSELIVTGSATVADDGTGVLSVLNGASFSAQSLTIGSQGDSSGALVVSGNNTTLTVSGELNIGTAAGTGDLTVGPGATVDAAVVNLQGGVVLEGGELDPTVYIENGGSTTGGFGTIASDFILLEGTILSNGSKSGKQTEVVQGTVVGGGTADIKGSVSVNGPGILQIGTHDTIELTGAVLNTATTTFTDNLTPTGAYTVNNSVVDVVFQDATGVLQLDDIGGFAGTVATWHAGDSFVATGETLSNPSVVNGDTLVVQDSGPNAGAGGIDTIIFGSAINAGGFSIVGGNTIVACFAEGTRIETVDGPVTVEHLRVGDRVVTADACAVGERAVALESSATADRPITDDGCEPIVWIGQRAVNCRAHPAPETVLPVRVRNGAFGENVPERDLYLSPDHAVFLGGVLIPVKLLINGATITQVGRAEVTYYHVELPRHAVILAEGLPVESYLDTGDRANFLQAGEPIRLFPDFVGRLSPRVALLWETAGVAPLVQTGPRLDAARRAVSGVVAAGGLAVNDPAAVAVHRR